MKVKLTILLGLVLMCAHQTFAQGTLEYTIEVFDKAKQPVKDLKVELEETSTGKKISQKTDEQGIAHFTVNEGNTWWLHVGAMKKLSTLKVPEDGITRGKQQVPYVPESMMSRDNLPDRTKLQLKVSDQSNLGNVKAIGQTAIVNIVLHDRSGVKVKNTAVALTCVENSTQFNSVTNDRGVAKFLVPVGHIYHIDVDEVDYYQKLDLPKSFAGFESTVKVSYNPTVVSEQNINDTIYQTVSKSDKSSATRAIVSVKVKDINGQMLPNEYVFAQELNGSKVYRGVTNGDGEVLFQLPLHKRYMIHFQFEPDVDVIDLNAMYGQVNRVDYVLTYRPIKRLAYPGQFIPTPDEIFLTEFHTFIDRQWPKPKEGKLVDVFFSWGNKVNDKSKEAVLELGIVTPTSIPKNFKRDPINVCFVLDKSGSMAGHERIDSLKTALAQFIDKLNADDVVSLVVFSDNAEVLVSSRPKGNAEFIKESISMISPMGGTNIFSGLQAGFKEVQAGKIPSGVNRIVLLSDGYGSKPPADVINEAKSYVAQGVDISAIGVGSNYNYALMSQLASLSGGLIHYVGNADNMSEVFSQELYSLILPVASDLKLEIEYNDHIVFKHLYGFDFQEKKPIAKLQIPQIYAGMKKLGVVKFDLPKPKPDIEKYPVIIRYSFFNPGTHKREQYEEKAILEWSPFTGKLELIKEHEKRKLYAIAIMNQSIKVMADAFASEDFKAAKEAVDNCKKQIEELYPKAKDEDVQKLYSELDNYSHALQQQIANIIQEEKKNVVPKKKDMN